VHVDTRRDVLLALARIVAFVTALALVAWRFRDELEHWAKWFVDRFGPVGMAAGSFLADGIHFPVPPQFYLVAGVADGTGRAAALASVVFGSVLGGLVAFALGRTKLGARLTGALVRRSRVHAERFLARRGMTGLVVASLLPVSYWLLCVLAGALGLPWRSYGILAVMRVPKIVLSYAFIVVLWHATSRS
jgi:membrane protein YqaA with SNARE-associated domain